jgi:hypothetical protein
LCSFLAKEKYFLAFVYDAVREKFDAGGDTVLIISLFFFSVFFFFAEFSLKESPFFLDHLVEDSLFCRT